MSAPLAALHVAIYTNTVRIVLSYGCFMHT